MLNKIFDNEDFEIIQPIKDYHGFIKDLTELYKVSGDKTVIDKLILFFITPIYKIENKGE